jgi:hypothetical protein
MPVAKSACLPNAVRPRSALAFVILLVLAPATAEARSSAPLYDPVALNIGLSCQWEWRCMTDQHRAMDKALAYVRKYEPPQWRLHLCNRNAARNRSRVDWVGFNHCVRNESLRPVPPPKVRRRR